MFIGHLPAGYLASIGARKMGYSTHLCAGILIGSVCPDIDILWFYLVDNQSTHHHHYITHKPVVWALIGALGLLLRSGFLIGLGLGGLIHLCLDTIVGNVAWFWPYSNAGTTLIEVQPTHDHWILSFLARWTFKVEIALVILAAAIFTFRRGSKGNST
ncbi:metal-dependent hydrolase [Cognatishimia sp.]|uniref:metal-dependent hydrolase n=1 Tax=Cognatishimia sp. TaxID=2211648 RepID=UPI0035166B91